MVFQTKFQKLIIASILVLSGIGIAFATFYSFSGTSGVAHVPGVFRTGGLGNAGRVSFEIASGSTAGIEGFNISGQFYIETIGLATFDVGTNIITPPSGNILDPWPVIGTATSNAGAIYLDTSGSGATYYDPNTKVLLGYAMNRGIGKIPFGVMYSTGLTGSGIEGQVKVIGNIGGNSAFDTFYSLGSKFNTSLMNDTLNRIRRNVSLLTRNIPVIYTNSTFATHVPLDNKLFFINTSSSSQELIYTSVNMDFPTSTTDSMIIVGGDLIIDTNIINPTSIPKGIIVLKNEAGVGGNVSITDTVKKIESSIFAEGTIYSGNNKTDLYNDSGEEVENLPPNQLYIYGSVMSRNTIGGSTQSGGAICVYNENSCTFQRAIPYDLNYFRSYSSGSVSERAYPDNRYDGYSLIIEQDSRLYNDPPPGFETK